MTDDITTLASAYLDGAATREEVERVEGDLDALAEVERLRQVRAVVGDIEPPPISQREAHLAAALDAWDRLPESERSGGARGAAAAGIDPATAAAAASMSTPPRTARRRAPRSNGWILAAAASLVVLLAGGLTLRSITGDDSDPTQDGDSSAAVEDAVTDSPEQEQNGESGDESAPAVGEFTTDPSLEPNEDISELDTETDDAIDSPPPEEGLEELDDSDELTVFAADALDANGNPIAPPVAADDADDADGEGAEASVATTAPGARSSDPADQEEAADEPADEATVEAAPTQLPLCGRADFIVGPAVYNGIPVVVEIDQDRNEVIAYRPSDCAVVARAPLP